MWTVACIYSLVPNMEYWPNIRPLGAWISGPLFQIKPWTTRRTSRSYKLQYDFEQDLAISVGIDIHSRTLLVVLSGIGDTYDSQEVCLKIRQFGEIQHACSLVELGVPSKNEQ